MRPDVGRNREYENRENTNMMEKDAKIYVAGHRGMVGSAIIRQLEKEGYHNIITRTHKELNLCRQDEVEKFFAEEKPDYGKGRRYHGKQRRARGFYV